jgi:hypothetical protein
MGQRSAIESTYLDESQSFERLICQLLATGPTATARYLTNGLTVVPGMIVGIERPIARGSVTR